MTFFKVHHISSQSRARTGLITTDHGVIQTPAFVPVGTKGTIKGITNEQIESLHIQTVFVNTYHLVVHPGIDVMQKANGIHAFSKFTIPLMSDSGGFQVFSLANQQQRRASIRGEEQPLVEKISEDGVLFRSVYDGQLIHFTPEMSMDFQRTIGADINMAFDECTYYPATHKYAEKAMKRTHEWLKRCVKHKAGVQNFEPLHNQFLYGIIQGGTFEDLRKESAEFVLSQNTPGIAIGGVSVGETKEEMRSQVEWVAPYLPKDRPVHLLGVGQIDDIVDLVKQGIDTFDCVEPTRVARIGRVYETKKIMDYVETGHAPSLQSSKFDFDINKAIYKADLSLLDENCSCSTCVNYSKAYIHHLFKQRELLGYTLLSYHNLFVMEKLMEKIRELIEMS